MDFGNVTIGLAFVAGLISFISPCVLPLVPAYIGYLGGRVTNTVAGEVRVGTGGQAVVRAAPYSRFNTFLHGVAFVAGFAFVFVIFGLLTTAFVQQVGGRNVILVTKIIGRLGGVLIIFFGLHFMGVLPSVFNRLMSHKRILSHPLTSVVMAITGIALIVWGFTGTLSPSLTSTLTTVDGDVSHLEWTTIIALFLASAYVMWLVLGRAFTTPKRFWTAVIMSLQNALYADTRRQMTAKGGQGYSGSVIMGVIFSAGWTPCIGPVYGAVLTLAANTGDVVRAGPLLLGYALGLGVPFMLTALLLDGAQGVLRKLQRHMHKIELVSGAFLVLIGYLVAVGSLQDLSQSLAQAPELVTLSTNIENSVIGSFSGEATAIPAPTGIEPTAQATVAPLGSITGAAEAITGPNFGTSVGDRVADFEAVTDSGETVKLSDLKGKFVLLNFWATWCIPCRTEMPEFEKAYQQNESKGFTILAINNQETREDVQGFRDELGVTFPMLMDEQGALQEKFGVSAYPSTFLIDPDGVIVARQFGALTAEQIDELVSSALT